MSTAITNESKNTVTLTLETKPNLTWDSSAPMTWDSSAPGTWNVPGTPTSLEAKNTVALTNEAKL